MWSRLSRRRRSGPLTPPRRSPPGSCTSCSPGSPSTAARSVGGRAPRLRDREHYLGLPLHYLFEAIACPATTNFSRTLLLHAEGVAQRVPLDRTEPGEDERPRSRSAALHG